MTNKDIPLLDDLSEEDNTSLVPLSAAGEWQEIIDQVVSGIMGKGEIIPEDVIKAAEYLICGWPTYKVAKRLNRSPSTIRGWLTNYPEVTAAIYQGQRELHRWRMSRLEQQFLSAVEASQRILDVGTEHDRPRPMAQGEEDEDFEPVPINTKLLAIQAQQARYIISLFAGQKMDVQIEGPEERKPALKAEQDALDYIVGAIKEELHTIDAVQETTFRIKDAQVGVSGPMLDDKGNPFYGELGEVDTNPEGTLCHVCGKRVPKLYMHVTNGHKMKERMYEITFMLDRGTLKEHGR